MRCVAIVGLLILCLAPTLAWGQVCESGWSYGQNAPTTIYRGQAAYSEGLVYMTTGADQDGNQIATLYVYDVAADSWNGGGCSYG
ncbi:MAG: hypothetical protein P9M14_16460 [Candidatus Alcyoniella australis]|nr:hypothetical protein [Candidatus Alcyoniella australis]